jgi:hypothetical protein
VNNENKHDQNFKIRTHGNDKCCLEQFWTFEEFISVDEMIVKYYGHNSLKHFTHGRPLRFGYKLWVLHGASRHCFNFSCVVERT